MQAGRRHCTGGEQVREGAQGALVEAGNKVAQLLAEARADSAGGRAAALLVRQVFRQLLHQRVAPALQQDHQVCAGGYGKLLETGSRGWILSTPHVACEGTFHHSPARQGLSRLPAAQETSLHAMQVQRHAP